MASGSNLLKVAGGVLKRRLNFISDVAILKPSVVRRRDEITEMLKEKAKQASESELARRARDLKEYYKLEMAPPSSAEEMKKFRNDLKLMQEFIQSGCFKFLTVKQALLLILVGTEVVLWFFLGETIGKMHIVGYKV